MFGMLIDVFALDISVVKVAVVILWFVALTIKLYLCGSKSTKSTGKSDTDKCKNKSKEKSPSDEEVDIFDRKIHAYIDSLHYTMLTITGLLILIIMVFID